MVKKMIGGDFKVVGLCFFLSWE